MIAGVSSEPGRSEAKRRAIVDAATRMFLAEGYAATAMDALSAAAGVSKRTVYNHFPNKRELFRAVVGRMYEALVAAGTPGIADDAPPEEALPAYAARVLDHLRRPDVQQLLRLVIAEHHRFPELAFDLQAEGKGPAVGMLAHYLAAQAARGRLKIDQPARAASEFLGAVKEGCYWPSLLGLPVEPDGPAISSAVGAFLRAYAPDR